MNTDRCVESIANVLRQPPALAMKIVGTCQSRSRRRIVSAGSLNKKNRTGMQPATPFEARNSEVGCGIRASAFVRLRVCGSAPGVCGRNYRCSSWVMSGCMRVRRATRAPDAWVGTGLWVPSASCGVPQKVEQPYTSPTERKHVASGGRDSYWGSDVTHREGRGERAASAS